METAEAADREHASKVVEMHGRLFNVQCTSCDHVEFNRSSPICEGLAGTEKLVEKNVMDPELPLDSLPRCSSCGALARPGVVWFGEGIPNINAIEAIVEEADLCIVVGTASTVRMLEAKCSIATDLSLPGIPSCWFCCSSSG